MVAVYVVVFSFISMAIGVLILNHMWSEVHKELDLCKNNRCEF